MTRPRPENDVFIVGAARTDSVKYSTNNYRSLSDLLAEPIRQIPEYVLNKVDTVYAIHRYPTPLSLGFDRETFLKKTALRQGDILQIYIDDRSVLGGMNTIQKVITDLGRGDASTVLVTGGEVFEPSVWHRLRVSHPTPSTEGTQKIEEEEQTSDRVRYQLAERRFIMNKFGGLPERELSIGLTPMSANALVADAFFRDSSLTLDEMGELMQHISVHMEKYAYMNPSAYQHHKEGKPMDRITMDRYERQVKRGRKWPFTLLDLCSISNGAGALVFTNDPGPLVHKVQVLGCVINKRHANTSLLDRPRLSQFDSNKEAWRELKRIINIDLQRPRPGGRPLMSLELFDIYTFQVAMTLIEMGMYDNARQILRDFKNGYFDPAPKMFEPPPEKLEIDPNCGVILNPSGGSKDGHPNGSYALIKAAECFFHLAELDRGDRSLSLPAKDLELALIQTLSGIGNTAGILALKKCPV
jgi:hypothetical protein